MNVLDGRQAVQERLEALDTEREVLVSLLAGYDTLTAIHQPEQGQLRGPSPAPASMPEAGDHPPVASPPAPLRHSKETFVCSRCPQTFKTRGWRDRHEAKHEPIPDVSPNGGERIRHTPPAQVVRWDRMGASTGAGQ